MKKRKENIDMKEKTDFKKITNRINLKKLMLPKREKMQNIKDIDYRNESNQTITF